MDKLQLAGDLYGISQPFSMSAKLADPSYTPHQFLSENRLEADIGYHQTNPGRVFLVLVPVGAILFHLRYRFGFTPFVSLGTVLFAAVLLVNTVLLVIKWKNKPVDPRPAARFTPPAT